jgi:hypothetical protein
MSVSGLKSNLPVKEDNLNQSLEANFGAASFVCVGLVE